MPGATDAPGILASPAELAPHIVDVRVAHDEVTDVLVVPSHHSDNPLAADPHFRGRAASDLHVADLPPGLVGEPDPGALGLADVDHRLGLAPVTGEHNRLARAAGALRLELPLPDAAGLEEHLVAGLERDLVVLVEGLDRARGG